jgi:xanthine/CO dehydrogenase XdhC/CoxF family maturation factor
MTETTEILSAIERLVANGERAALATIVAVRGSTYRQPGARLLIPERGPLLGNLSGGCLEAQVAGIGRDVMTDGVPRLATFDLTADGDEVWGSGLGCNGAFEVIVEPAERANATAGALRTALEEKVGCCLVTVLASSAPGVKAGDRVLVGSDGRRAGGTGDEKTDAALADLARAGLATGVGGNQTVSLGDGELRAVTEVILPPPRLLVCGAGHDAVPLVRLASSLGWRVTVADVRRAFLSADRFPEAAAFLDADPRAVAEAFQPEERAFAVVMTHNYLRDADYLRALLPWRLAYLAVMGPRRRTEQLLGELEREGLMVTDADRQRLHAPAGLDLGAEGPEEVAWSIVAEMLAVLRGRAGGPLRDRDAAIHAG